MYSIKGKYNSLDFISIIILILLAAVPFFIHYRILFLLFTVFTALRYLRKEGMIVGDSKIGVILLIYILLALVQGAIWGISIFSLITSFLFTFLINYYFFRLYKFDLLFIFEEIFYVWVIIIMILFMFQEFVPGSHSFFTSILSRLNPYDTDAYAETGGRSLIIYTFRPNLVTEFGFLRNSGFSHEPGGFAAFINLAVVINYVRYGTLLTKRNILYVVALLTTVSTAGIISLGVLGLLLIRNTKYRLISILILPLFGFGIFYVYGNYTFMQDKVENQFSEQTKYSLNDETEGRFYGSRKSINVLMKYPLHGRGLLSMTMPKNTSHPEFAAYGWLSEMARYGLVFGIIYMFLFAFGLYKFIKLGDGGVFEFIVILISILINLSAQVFLNMPFFMVFFYIGLYSKQMMQKVRLNAQ